jgi:hypothetical protein
MDAVYGMHSHIQLLLEFPHSQAPYLRSLGHILCCSGFLTFIPAASTAITALRSSWPWDLENLFAPPQVLQLEGCCVPVLEGEILQFLRLCFIYVDVSTYHVNLHKISTCMSCQHRHSRNVQTSIPLFSIVSDSDSQIAAHPSLALRGQDQGKCLRQSLLSNPFTAV